MSRMADESTMFLTMNLLMALSFGTMMAEDSHRTRFTCTFRIAIVRSTVGTMSCSTVSIRSMSYRSIRSSGCRAACVSHLFPPPGSCFASSSFFFFFHSIASFFFFSRSTSCVSCSYAPSILSSLSPVPLVCTYVSSSMFVPSVVAAFLRHGGRVVAAHHPHQMCLTQKRRVSYPVVDRMCHLEVPFLGYPKPGSKEKKRQTISVEEKQRAKSDGSHPPQSRIHMSRTEGNRGKWEGF